MNRTTEVGLALDIDHLATADARSRADPGRAAEGLVTGLDHHQPVHLPELAAVGVDQQRVPQDRLVQALTVLVGAPVTRVNGLLYMPRIDDSAAAAHGEMIGLVQQLGEAAQVQ